jgi:hypothetical protein
MKEERILTWHPAGKAGVNILKKRYDAVCTAILKTIAEHGEITFDALTGIVEKDLTRNQFDGKPLWYITTVKLDLEARKVIERIPKTNPQKLRIAKKE